MVLHGSNVDYCFHPWCLSAWAGSHTGLNILSGEYLSKVLDAETWLGYQLGVAQLPCHSVTLVRLLTLTMPECFLLSCFSYHTDICGVLPTDYYLH